MIYMFRLFFSEIKPTLFPALFALMAFMASQGVDVSVSGPGGFGIEMKKTSAETKQELLGEAYRMYMIMNKKEES